MSNYELPPHRFRIFATWFRDTRRTLSAKPTKTFDGTGSSICHAIPISKLSPTTASYSKAVTSASSPPTTASYSKAVPSRRTMAKTFDGPPTLERSGSEHRRAVTSLALLERARAWEWVKDPPAGEGQVGQI